MPPGPSTPSSISRTCGRGLLGDHALALRDRLLAAADGVDDVRRAQDAAVRDRGVAGRHLHRRDREALAHRHVGRRSSRSSPRSRARCPAPRPAGRRRSACRSRSGGPTGRSGARRASARSAPRRRWTTRRGCPRPCASPSRASCASAISRSATWRMGGRLNVGRRRDLAVLERAGDGERLERRAGLVRRAGRAVLHRVVGRVAEVVRVDARPVGERDQRAVARVHHERGRALGLPLPRRPPRAPPRCGPGCSRRASAARRSPARVRLSSRSSIVSPSASRTSRRSPSRPRSCVSSCTRGPESPWPSVPTLPSSCDAIQSRGYSRLNSGMNSSPSMLELLRARGAAHRARGARGRRSRCRAGRAARAARPRGLPRIRRELGGDPDRVLDQVRRRGDRLRGLGDRQLGAVDVGDRPAPGGDDDVAASAGWRRRP